MNHRIAVIGLGSIGRRHVTNLLDLGYTDLIGVDHNNMHGEDRLPVVKNVKDLEYWHITHAVICTPPKQHFGAAVYLSRWGTPMLVEKPLSDSLIAAKAMTRDMAVSVGYMERTNGAVLKARKFAQENPVKNAYLELYWKMTAKTYDQDFLLESSHVFDTARFILGDMKVASGSIKGTGAEIRLEHAGGYTFIAVDANAVPMRRLTLYAHNGRRFETIYGLEDGEWDLCYKDELRAFLQGKPLCPAHDGLAVMEIIEDTKRMAG